MKILPDSFIIVLSVVSIKTRNFMLGLKNVQVSKNFRIFYNLAFFLKQNLTNLMLPAIEIIKWLFEIEEWVFQI